MYELIFKSPAKKFLKNVDKGIQKRILDKIKKLKENPHLGIPLVGNLSGLSKLRVGKYRIIYQVVKDELIVYILDIDKRGKIY